MTGLLAGSGSVASDLAPSRGCGNCATAACKAQVVVHLKATAASSPSVLQWWGSQGEESSQS